MNSKKSIGARTLTYPNPVLIVGTYDSNGNPNIMTASWTGVCCSEPPCIAVSLRRARKTYDNVLETNAFTINVPSARFVKEADYLGLYSGHQSNKFEDLNLTPIKSEFVNAPYIAEFLVNLECSVIHSIELGSHIQFIGEIKDIKVNSELKLVKGIPLIKEVDPIVYDSSSRAYYSIGEFLADAYKIGLKL